MKKAELIPYHKWADKLLTQFEEAKIVHVRRVTDARADALARQAAKLLSGLRLRISPYNNGRKEVFEF